jgi:hypothetical protein
VAGLTADVPGARTPDTDAALLAAQYRRYGAVAAVVIATGWHGVYDLTGTLGGLDTYRAPVVAVLCWLVYAAVGLRYGVSLLRGRVVRRAYPGAVAAVLITAALVVALPPSALMTPANWGWGSVGWLGVLVLWDRPLAQLGAFLAMDALVMLVGMIAHGVTDRVSLAVYLMVIVGAVTLQLGFGAGARLLTATGDWVGARSAEQTGAAVRRARAEAVHAARLRLGRSIHEDTLPVLRRLAAGADPSDAAIRHRCAVGAARLRSLLLQARGEPDPLTIELRTGADIAARTGVVVDLEVHGRVPELDDDVRHALTAPALAALASARRRARVTVTALGAEVVVSVLGDGDGGGPVEEAAVPSVAVGRYEVEEGRWVESRWTGG